MSTILNETKRLSHDVVQAGDGTEQTKTITTNAAFNSTTNIDATIVASPFTIEYSHSWSFAGLRSQDVAQVAAADNLVLPFISNATSSIPTKFKSVVNVAV